MPIGAPAALNSILLALEQDDGSAPFDALFRQWWRDHARAQAPARCRADRHALEGAVFASASALRMLGQRDTGPLVRDLAMPTSAIRDCLFAARPGSAGDLTVLLNQLFRPGLITVADRAGLVDSGVAFAMPVGWCYPDAIMARYTAAGIVVQDLATELEMRAARVRAGNRFAPPALARSGLLGSVSGRAFRA